jgi:hypothetical protein
MKQTAVPAQVTTVEDRIVGNLGLGQVVLLALPVVGAGAVFSGLPPIMHLALYKLVLVILCTAICGTLAIRIKGKILLLWLIIRLRYNLRPGYYVYTKNSLANRELYETIETEEALADDEPEPTTRRRTPSSLTAAETMRLFAAMDNPASKLSFATNKKGNLYVRITEIKEQG